MTRRAVRTTIVIASSVVLLGTAWLSMNRVPAETAAAAAQDGLPRTADGKPDLSGIWQVLTTAAWNIEDHQAAKGVPAGQGVVEGGELPYLPAALATRNENFKNRLTLDPETKCFQPGMPRIMYMPYPFQIVQSTNKIHMAYAFSNSARTIHLDKVEGPPDDTWMGHSAGRWEGDTLVVDVTNFNDKAWFDRAGNFHSDALHLVERFTPISPDAIRYEVTIEDPKVFARPWRIAMPIYRRLEPNIQLLEYRCIEFVEEFLYGHLRKDQLVKHWEGETIVVDVRRKVPPGDRLYEQIGK